MFLLYFIAPWSVTWAFLLSKPSLVLPIPRPSSLSFKKFKIPTWSPCLAPVNGLEGPWCIARHASNHRSSSCSSESCLRQSTHLPCPWPYYPMNSSKVNDLSWGRLFGNCLIISVSILRNSQFRSTSTKAGKHNSVWPFTRTWPLSGLAS